MERKYNANNELELLIIDTGSNHVVFRKMENIAYYVVSFYDRRTFKRPQLEQCVPLFELTMFSSEMQEMADTFAAAALRFKAYEQETQQHG